MSSGLANVRACFDSQVNHGFQPPFIVESILVLTGERFDACGRWR